MSIDTKSYASELTDKQCDKILIKRVMFITAIILLILVIAFIMFGRDSYQIAKIFSIWFVTVLTCGPLIICMLLWKKKTIVVSRVVLSVAMVGAVIFMLITVTRELGAYSKQKELYSTYSAIYNKYHVVDGNDVMNKNELLPEKMGLINQYNAVVDFSTLFIVYGTDEKLKNMDLYDIYKDPVVLSKFDFKEFKKIRDTQTIEQAQDYLKNSELYTDLKIYTENIMKMFSVVLSIIVLIILTPLFLLSMRKINYEEMDSEIIKVRNSIRASYEKKRNKLELSK